MAALNQLGVTLNYLEGGLLALAPKADVDFVLTNAEVIHG
jgi:hypothetical protein